MSARQEHERRHREQVAALLDVEAAGYRRRAEEAVSEATREAWLGHAQRVETEARKREAGK